MAEQPSNQCWERPVVAEPLASWICMAELPANRCQGIAPLSQLLANQH